MIADLLLRELDDAGWNQAVVKNNALKAKTPATATRLARLIQQRLQTMSPELWRMVRDGTLDVAIHASLAAAIEQSFLLGDCLDQVVRDQYRGFGNALTKKMWFDFLEGCRGRDPMMPQWQELDEFVVTRELDQRLRKFFGAYTDPVDAVFKALGVQ